jgi:hypothetical protein
MMATDKRSAKFKKHNWSKREMDFLRENYGYLSTQEIADRLNRTYHAVRGMAVRNGIKSVAQREYAVYFDDDFQFTGTAQECADELGIQKDTLIFYTNPSHAKRAKRGIFVVDLGKWKKEENI